MLENFINRCCSILKIYKKCNKFLSRKTIVSRHHCGSTSYVFTGRVIPRARGDLHLGVSTLIHSQCCWLAARALYRVFISYRNSHNDQYFIFIPFIIFFFTYNFRHIAHRKEFKTWNVFIKRREAGKIFYGWHVYFHKTYKCGEIIFVPRHEDRQATACLH